MADDVCFALLRNTIYQILHSAGFESSHGEPANVLADIFGQYIQLLASSASTYAQLAGRTVASPWDIADGLVDVQVTLDQLQDWLDSEQGQFLAPSWSTKADPNVVLKDVVTKGQVHHEVGQMLYQYCAADQRYYQTNDDKLEHTNGDDIIETARIATTLPSTMRQDRGQLTMSLPDYVPLHLPTFPSPDSDNIFNQPNDTPHQSNQKGDHTTMQSEYSATTMLSSLLPSTDHKLPSSSSPHTLSTSKRTNDNPFTHVVSFDDSSLASGNSLSLALSSSLQQPQLDFDEKNEMELAKKQRRAEMEATINTIMEQYRQQQQKLNMDGNQIMFQHITQKEAAPGKTSLGTRDSILDEMVYRLAPPVALARLSSPNLLLDTAITPTPPPENPASVSDTAGKDAPIDAKDSANRSTQPSIPSPSTSKQTTPLPAPAKKTISPPQTTMDQLTQSPTIPAPATLSTSSSSKGDPSYTPGASSTTTQRPQSNNTASFGSPPIPTSSQPPVKTPMSIAMLSARGSTNSIKEDKNGLSVKTAEEAKNGTVLPKKKKHRVSMDMNDNAKQTPTMSHSQPPSTTTAAAATLSKQQPQRPMTSPTANTGSATTLLKKKKKKKDDNNGLERQQSAANTPPKVRFREHVDISNSSYEHPYWSTPSPSLHHPAQPMLSIKPTTIPASTPPTPHSPMIYPPPPTAAAAAAPAPSPAPWSSSATIPTSSSSYTATSDHIKKKKKKKHDDQPMRFSPAKAPNHSSLLAAGLASSGPPTKMGSSSTIPPKKQAAPPPLSFSSYSSTPIATTATAPIMLLPTPATNMYYDTAETVQCICENPTVDYGTFMISCDRCMVWFHGSCVRIAEHDQVDDWICTRCQ